MTHSTPKGIRPIGAWMMCLLLLAVQLALPVVALAAALDTAILPNVTLTYWPTEDNPVSVPVLPTQMGEQQYAYWATLPQEAFQGTTVTISITPSTVDSLYSYTPGNDTPLMVMEAADFAGFSQLITAYLDGVEVASFPLYLSTLPPPVLQGTLVIHYVDAGGQEFNESPQLKPLDPGVHNITPEFWPTGYKLNPETSSFQVTVDAMGVTTPWEVVFEFLEDSQPPVDEGGGDETDPGDDPNPPVVPPVDEGGPGGDENNPPQQPETPTITPMAIYGLTNAVVNFRTAPDTNSAKAVADARKGTYVWVQGSLAVGQDGWYQISYNGMECYVMSKFVDLLSQEDSDAYNYAQASPVPGTETQPPADVQVLISYVDADNPATVLYEQWATCPVGAETPVTAQGDAVPGYTLVGDNQVVISVSADGKATPSTVVFQLQKVAVVGTFTVRYVDENNTDIAEAQHLEMGEGAHDISPDAGRIPAGYVLAEGSPATQQVTIDGQGIAAPDTITFTYQKPPVTGAVTVRYVDGSNAEIAASQTLELSEGDHTVSPDASRIPAGYVLAEGAAATQPVTIDGQGVATPATLTFTYQKPSVSATVAIEYKANTGETLATGEQTLAEGQHSITPDAAKVPTGYSLAEGTPSSVNVTVDASGATPATVTFTYTLAVQNPQVPIYYRDEIGQDIVAPQVQEIEAGGSATIQENVSLVPTGYTRTSVSSVTVNVSKEGVANPAEVLFTYQKAPTTATVSVNYMGQDGKNIIPAQIVTLTGDGAFDVMPDDKLIPGYALVEGSAPSVKVNVVGGVANPSSVSFTFKATTMYMGYALTTSQTTLRNNADSNDSSILTTLPKDTLLYLNGQSTVGNTVWNGAQTVLGDTYIGIVLDSAVKHIDSAEAKKLIDAYNEAHKEPEETRPKDPVQNPGYYLTIMNNVPLRTTNYEYSAIKAMLPIDVVVEVTGQLLGAQDNYTWHISKYEGSVGYIREGQIRKMTDAEVQVYLNSQKTNPPTVTSPVETYNPNTTQSSYGYVTANNVNFRLTPNGTKIKTLNQYAMVLIYGSKQVSGTTWYSVNQGGTIGWIHGSYFHQMSVAELNSFLGSSQYYQGIANNTPSTGGTTGGSTSGGGTSSGGTTGGTSNSSGTASQGNISSVEDWNVGTWQNTGVSGSTSYAPFDPYSTPVASTSPGTSPSTSPSATFVIGTMIPITYDDESRETQTDSSPWVGIVAAVAVLGGAGGVYAYALNQNKKRKAAASKAAAARRTGTGAAGAAGAAGTKANQQGAQSPYARRAVAAPPAGAATDKKQDGKGRTPGAPGATGTNPYGTPSAPGTPTSTSQGVFGAPVSGEALQNPYARPAGQGTVAPGTKAPSDVSGVDGKGLSGTGGAPGATPGAAPKSNNPYVQPISGSTDSSTPRRSSRTQRYQNADKKDGEE